MNKGILQEIRSKYHTETTILKRIEFCEARRGKYSHTYPYNDQLPCLYAVLGEIRVRNRHKTNIKLAYNQHTLKNNTITRRRERVSLYEKNLKEFIKDRWVYTGANIPSNSYKYYRFFFPISRMSSRGTINPIKGFTEEVALMFIDSFIKTELFYNRDYYKEFCKYGWTGAEFICQYNKGIDSYEKMFPEAPPELLYKLYNIRQAGSTAIGNGEYLMRLKIRDMTKEKHGDLCTESGVNLEMKATGGRLSCQKPSDVQTMGGYMLEDHMIEAYEEFKKNGWSDRMIIKKFAYHKIQTYRQFLTKDQMDFFVQDMTENWERFFINGEFTKYSVNRINGCHDAYAYPLLEGFTHLKVDSSQPSSIKNAKDFDVHFNIFNKDDFATPGLILRMIESEQIKFYGFIKNNGRDKAVHVGI